MIFDLNYYTSQPWTEIFAVWHGGLAIYGGLLTGAIVLFVFSYYRAINPLDFLDIAAPGVMIAQAIGRWGNFMNGRNKKPAVRNRKVAAVSGGTSVTAILMAITFPAQMTRIRKIRK